jgi:hypothetical protein
MGYAAYNLVLVCGIYRGILLPTMVVTAQTNYPAFSSDSAEGPRERIQYVGVLYAMWLTGLGKKFNPRRIHSEGLM